MTTNTQRTKSTVQAPKAAPFDRVNSQTALTIYHRDHWQVGDRTTNCAKYYLKKTHDPAYALADGNAQIVMEMAAANRTVETKLFGPNAKNPMTYIAMYLNNNQGGSLAGVQNTFVCSLNILAGKRFERKMNPYITDGDSQAEQALNDMLAAWEYSITRHA